MIWRWSWIGLSNWSEHHLSPQYHIDEKDPNYDHRYDDTERERRILQVSNKEQPQCECQSEHDEGARKDQRIYAEKIA